MHAMTTGELISAYVTWRMRLIPAKPRSVKFWSGGITPSQARAMRSRLDPLLHKVRKGEDLTPHLSQFVKKRGLVLPQARRPGDRRRHDIDAMLIRHGLHHFHVGDFNASNPKGRSQVLVFAEVLEKEFRVVAVSDHSAFEPGTLENRRLFRVSSAYVAKDIPRGEGFMSNPVMSSGHAMVVVMFGVHCEDLMKRLDPELDNPAFIGNLYQQHATGTKGELVTKPNRPSFVWDLQDLQFGFIERTTKTFFCLSPFFVR